MANHTTERERAERDQGPNGEPLSGKTDEPEVDEARARRAANLFDLRRLIGGLFVLYGVILTVLGIGASDKEIEKAAGLNLNLWTGLSLLVVGALVLVWAFTRPLSDQLEEDEEPEEDKRHEPDSEDTSSRSGRDHVGPGGGERLRPE
jgi:hypothetical protein